MVSKNLKIAIVLAFFLLIAVIALNAPLSIYGIETPSLQYTATARCDKDPLTGKCLETFTVVTPNIKLGPNEFVISNSSEEQVCLTVLDKKTCLLNGAEPQEIMPFIAASYQTTGLTETDDETFPIVINYFVDADNAFNMSYSGRTGLKLNEDFSAPISLKSNFPVIVNAGVTTESRSLILEQGSSAQMIGPEPYLGTKTFEAPIGTTKLGLNEVRIKPFLRFSREDRNWDVTTQKVLIVNFRVSPQIEGQALPEGSIGLVDVDSPVQRTFTVVQESTKKATESPPQLLFIMIVATIIGVLLIGAFLSARQKRKGN